MAVMVDSYTSVQSFLTHLDDSDPELIEASLNELVKTVAHHWHEVSESLPTIEALSEKQDTNYAKLASLLASKVFFYMREYEDALAHALSARELFPIEERSQYVIKLTEQCIDMYRIHMQAKYFYDKGIGEAINKRIDNRLEAIVERMLQHCYNIREYENAVGIAIDCRRIDHVKKAVGQCHDRAKILDYIFKLCERVINISIFRAEVLAYIVEQYRNEENKNYNIICRCYFYLNRPDQISQILWELIQTSKTELVAYQVAFDLAEYQNEGFQKAIFDNIPKPPSTDNNNATNDKNQQEQQGQKPEKQQEQKPEEQQENAEVEGPNVSSNQQEWSKELKTRYDRLRSILLGEIIIPLNLDFLFRNNHSDLIILKRIKEAISERNSVLNNALICCNSIIHCGTTIDQFLRDNLEWMGRAAHWAKFTATASLGQIHHHHLDSSMTILEKYLPGSGGGPYQEGGALYALGLIHVGDNSLKTSLKIKEYLLKHMSQASNEILQHGSCLGLGLAALGTQQDNYLQEIRNILFQDRATPGEAAGIALGLILSGSGNSTWFDEMFQYAHETQHEKIIRGLGIGIAIMHYNLEENAQNVINSLVNDKDDTLRYGGCYTIGLSYACTANNNALSQLLHLAVSDVSNDVRRAAVTNIGFVLGNKSQQVPKVVQLLVSSYNSHVRYGAAAALGIACAGTGNLHALKLLKDLAKDQIDYVRQAAFISLGMLLMQHNDKETPQVKYVREQILMKTITNKRESTMSIMGAIIGFGLIDACGRNATISLLSFEGQKRMQSIVGMAIFWQYWYWYPLIPFISLSFQPTMIMSLNRNLQMPQIEFQSNAPPSLYAYVEPLKEEAKESKKVLTKAVLSTTNKQKARQAQIDKEKAKKNANENGENSEDVEMTDNEKNESDKSKINNSDQENKDQQENKEQQENKDKGTDKGADKNNANDNKMEVDEKLEEKKEESKYEILHNPARVTPNQQKYIIWCDKRYRPISKRLYGIIVVEDTMPEEEIKLVEFKTLDTQGVYGNEPEPPKPFYYLGD